MIGEVFGCNASKTVIVVSLGNVDNPLVNFSRVVGEHLGLGNVLITVEITRKLTTYNVTTRDS